MKRDDGDLVNVLTLRYLLLVGGFWNETILCDCRGHARGAQPRCDGAGDWPLRADLRTRNLRACRLRSGGLRPANLCSGHLRTKAPPLPS